MIAWVAQEVGFKLPESKIKCSPISMGGDFTSKFKLNKLRVIFST